MDLKESIWQISGKKADFYGLAEKFNIDPVIARIIRNRDIISEADIAQFLAPDVDEIPKPEELKDMDRAVSIIIAAIESDARIRIVGDYDTDGTCASYILYKGINSIKNIADYYIPDRISDGYGINRDIVQQASEDKVDLIITCDNGIAAIAEIAYAKELGMSVVITDHHQPVRDENAPDGSGCIMPKADAIVNPHRPDCGYAFKSICGANIAFKLICRLHTLLKSGREELIEELGYFAAIATVGDMMPLINENRALVKHCLSSLHKCKNIGLNTLIDLLDIDIRTIKAHHIGFRISPCINAGGRLSTAKLVMKLFLASGANEAGETAKELLRLNKERQDMTSIQTELAKKLISEYDNSQKVIVVYLPECHESIAGIVASRVKESYNRPSLVVTDSKDFLKGSGRSIDGYSMYDELSKCRDIFMHFGGHRMAAGFSLSKDKLTELESRLNNQCTLESSDIVERVVLDMELPPDYLSIRLIKQLELLEPFGLGNKKPIFGIKNAKVADIRQIGKSKQYLKLGIMSDGGKVYEALCFDQADRLLQTLLDKYEASHIEELYGRVRKGDIYLSLAYYPSVNSYKGFDEIQLMIEGFRL